MTRYYQYSFIALMLLANDAVADNWIQFAGPETDFTLRRQSPLSAEHVPTKRWQHTLGAGMSGVVAKDGRLYTHYLRPSSPSDLAKGESKRRHQEVVIALNADNGQAIWKHEYVAGWSDKQQAFGGRERAPQATPAICGDYLVSIGFTGLIHCIHRTSGQVAWSKDAVDEFKSVPVQFGFSASPIPFGDNVILLVGGQKGGLVCLHVPTGEVRWNVPCEEASYATPIVWKRTDGEQIVFVTRNRVVGVDAKKGQELWSHRLKEEGLTNVPTPMPLDEQGLLISGQGVKGTRRIDVIARDTKFVTRENWKSDEQFFYCNFIRQDDVLWGCNGNLLVAIDLQTGARIGRFRGYEDSNLIRSHDQLLVLHGDGHLSQLSLGNQGAEVLNAYSMLSNRCWTPPTLIGEKLLCRGDDQLICLDLAGGDPRASLKRSRIRKQMLKLSSHTNLAEKADALQRIVQAFERTGADEAWKVYTHLRDADPDSISYEDRLELIKLAEEQGLTEIVKQLKSQAAEDYPKRYSADREPSSEITRGKNGLLYLEFAIHNVSSETIQAYVKGPAAHPFSYGLPIRPSRKRLEKWPVGTKLFRTKNGIKKGLLFTVDAEFAGRTLEVPTVDQR